MKTTFEANNPLAVKVWSKSLAVESIRRMYFGKFTGTGDDNLVQVKEDLKKAAGDQITSGLRFQLEGDGILGDATLEGNEEAQRFGDDSIRIDQLRHAVRLKGQMTEQRVPYNLRQDARDALADWGARRMDRILANHLTGYTPANATPVFTGANTILAPSANRIIRPNGKTTDQSLVAGDEFDLRLLDLAKLQARRSRLTPNSTSPNSMPIRPLRIGGKDYYVAFLADDQVHDLRNSQWWTEIQLAAMQGGDITDNPIFSGALGIYNGIILHEWSEMPNGVHSTTGAPVPNTRRAVLAGAQAVSMAFGGNSSETRWKWREEVFDYDNQFGVGVASIFGLKKNRFIPTDRSTTEGEDFGTVVISTYAANPLG